jgi:RimJ/RimL family protein N-acetyltransferase
MMDVILETPRLVLRRMRESDTATLVTELNNFAIVRNTARVPHPYHLDDAVDFVLFANALDERSCVAAVELKSEPGVLIGVISYQWGKNEENAEIGYWFAEKTWGQGIGTEAASAITRRAFEVTKHDKLVACYHNDNPASARILSKLGFVVTGACSNFSKAQGREVPVTTMQLLKADWDNKKAAVV